LPAPGHGQQVGGDVAGCDLRAKEVPHG
jgi:hypothetical protein